MKSHIARMIEGMLWADGQLLPALAACPAAQGEALPLFGHVLAAEHVWLARLEKREARVAVWPTLSVAEIKEQRSQVSEVVCEARAGDMLVMRPMLLHASSRATSHRPRRVLHIEYAGEGLPGELEWWRLKGRKIRKRVSTMRSRGSDRDTIEIARKKIAMKACPDFSRSFIARTLLIVLIVALLGGCQRQAASPLAYASRTFGHRQLEQVLADRPDMAGVLADDDPVVAWVIAGFNGERIGQRVYWNGASPQSGQAAEHSPPYYHYPAHICISGGTETTPVDKWASLVFEFFNLENHKDFEELTAEAMAGKVSREQYGDRCVALEFRAIQKTKAFLGEHPIPYSPQGHDDWYEWLRTSLPNSADEYLASLREAGPRPGYNPRDYFIDYYDDAISPYVEWNFQRNSMQTVYDLFRRIVAAIFERPADRSSGA